jgi:outer membrane protein assembly factor BamB
MKSAMNYRPSLLTLALLAGPAAAADPGPWATYRGNPQRTGNTDGKAGPDKPTVLWTVRSQDHFVAAPVPVGDRVLLSGLGGFNRPTISLFPLAPAGAKVEPVWSKSAPYLTLASVSSAAVVADKGLLVFGDGMHQDSGGLLHCVTADGGRPVWQLPLPGDLVHLEGGPSIADGRVYIGGGAAGVICVELEKATLDGKDVDPPAIAKLQDAKWKELQARFEEQKKKDPDFAVPPNETQLLKPAPKKVWQVGEKRWHVDAAVNVAGGKVLVPTSFLDKEKVGERALYCLAADTGAEVWKAPLALNPWGGASVSGGTVVVPGSSVGYYFNDIKGAKGDLTALDLTTGQVKWKKDVPGGVVGCAALADDLAVCTATDGKVRAYKLADGDRAWLYDAKAPIFAPPAAAGGVVYVADLLGIVHALDLKTGAPKWTFPLPKDPLVMAPGMVYGGVTVHGGKLVVATCNLEGPFARRDTAVVCLGTR